MAARVLEISKHEGTPTAARPAAPGRRARLYRFPARTTAAHLQQDDAGERKSPLALHVAIELAVGLAVWLTWYVWHLAH